MQKKSLLGIYIVSLALGFTMPRVASAAAEGGMALGVGSGIVFPTLNHTLFVNPAGLTDAQGLSAQVAYLVDPGNAHASLIAGQSNFGVGAGFRQVGSDSTVEEFGAGFKFNLLQLGVTLRTQEFDGLDADVGVDFKLGQLKAAAIVRQIDGGPSRFDFGLGLQSGAIVFEADLKKYLDDDLGSGVWLMDVGIAATSGKISVGVGYATWYYDGGFNDGDIHAGLSVEVTQRIFAEAFYKPHPQEWSPGDWVLGARAQF